nr:polysaccharide deacetylase family protein [Streptomyces sp. NBRC 110468]
MRRRRGPGYGRAGVRSLIAVLALATVASGCAGGGEDAGGPASPAPGQQPGKAGPPPAAAPARALHAYAARLRAAHQARIAAARRWGLKRVPLTPPAPPAHKPEITTRKGFEVDDHEELGLPPVFTTVPTKDRVVFLTIDDGAEKDPAFLRMMTELKVPYTAFLSDYLVKDDYGYFKKMQDRGVALNNHTLHHPYLPALSYARQKREICGMQDVIEKRYGKRPALFRPPFGNYDRDTLRAAKNCGVRYAPLWAEEVFVDHWEYREWDQDLHPGDIVLSHFRGRGDWKGTMPDMVRRFLDKVTAKGYAVGRLEDYL